MDKEFKKLEIGKSDIVFKSNILGGKNCTIFALGSMVHPAIEAAKQLEKSNVSACVVNVRFVKPLDVETILANTSQNAYVVTVEEGTLSGGFGSAILELLADAKRTNPVLRIGLPDKFIEHGKRDQILDLFGLNSNGINDKVLDWIKSS